MRILLHMRHCYLAKALVCNLSNIIKLHITEYGTLKCIVPKIANIAHTW